RSLIAGEAAVAALAEALGADRFDGATADERVTDADFGPVLERRGPVRGVGDCRRRLGGGVRSGEAARVLGLVARRGAARGVARGGRRWHCSLTARLAAGTHVGL